MKTVSIQTSRPYRALIGKGLLPHCGEWIAEETAARRCVLVSDSNVAPLYARQVTSSLESTGFTVHSLTIPAGEEHKTLATCGELLSFFAGAGLTRGDFVIALGGGVVGDITGFAAAIYQRGIDFVQIPTTLLAACDASVGGKTAVDLPEGKNLAGAFHQPILVICDTDTFATLPPAVFSDGMAEVIKHALIADKDLLRILTQFDTTADIDTIVQQCITIKASFVSEDEREQGRRKLLNFGHTLGHAIETCSGYSISHGSAVAMGMVLAARAGENLGFSPRGTLHTTLAAVEHCKLPVHCPYTADELYTAATADKKRRGNGIDVVVLREIGRADAVHLTMEELRRFTEAAL